MTDTSLIRTFGAATAALFLSSVTAYAEVCDKVRPNWDPTGGQASQLDDILLLLGTVPGMMFLALVGFSLFLRSRWLCLFCATLSIALATVVTADWVLELGGDIREPAIAEGCMVAPYAVGAFTIAIAIVCLLVAVKKKRVSWT